MVIGYRIALVDNDHTTLSHLSSCVARAGHTVVVQASSDDEFIRLSGNVGLDLIVTNVRLPDTDSLTAAKSVAEKHVVPMIAISESFDHLTFDRTYAGPVFAHLMKPVREPELLAAIPLAIQRFQEFRTLREEACNMQKALEDRKLIERAKGILMRRQSLDEATAFLHLQKLARNHRLKMGDVAKSIILAEEALQAPAALDGSAVSPIPRSLSARGQRR
ncbi:MAG: ANTAR domain-containing protein [Planctomycetes bacterium]|nr:ANTAR domain-containing protein [Planctomycetota bacterium]